MSWDRSRYQASRSYPVASADTIMSTNGRPPPYATTAASHAADSPPSSAAPPLPPVEGSSSSSSSWSRRRERDDGFGSASASSSAGRRGDDPGWDAFRRNGSSTSASASTTTGLPPVSAPAPTSSATSLSLRRAEPSKLDRWDSGPSASGLPPPRPRASPPPPPAPPQAPKRFTTNNWGSATDSAVVEEKVVPRRFGPVPSGPAAGAGPPGGAWGRPNPGSFKSGGPGPAVSLGPQSFGPAPPTAPRGSRVFDSSVPLGPSRDRAPPSGPSRGRSRSPPPHQPSSHSSSRHHKTHSSSHKHARSPRSPPASRSPSPAAAAQRSPHRSSSRAHRSSRVDLDPSPVRGADGPSSKHHHSSSHRDERSRDDRDRRRRSTSRREPSPDKEARDHRERDRERDWDRDRDRDRERERERDKDDRPASSTSAAKRERWPTSTTTERDEKRARWSSGADDAGRERDRERGREPLPPQGNVFHAPPAADAAGSSNGHRRRSRSRSRSRERAALPVNPRSSDDGRSGGPRKPSLGERDVRMASPPPAARVPAPRPRSRSRSIDPEPRNQWGSRDREVPPPRRDDDYGYPSHSQQRPPKGLSAPADSGWGRKGGRVSGGGVGNGARQGHGWGAREPLPPGPPASRSAPVELDAFGRPRRDYRSPSPDMEEIRRKRKELAARDEAEKARVRDEEDRERREREREREKERKRVEREEQAVRDEEAERERERQLRLAEEAAEQRRRAAEQEEAERARQAAERAARGPTPPPPVVQAPQPIAFAPIKISLGQRKAPQQQQQQPPSPPPPRQQQQPVQRHQRDRPPPQYQQQHRQHYPHDPRGRDATPARADRRDSYGPPSHQPSPAVQDQPRTADPTPKPARPGRAADSRLAPSPAAVQPEPQAASPPPSPQPPRETYELLAQVGEGTYGKVYKACNTETGAFVALKRIRMEGEKDGFPVTAMREIKLLQSLRHPNVVALHEMMVARGACHMVFEYMDHDLTGILSQPQYVFDAGHLKSFTHQMLSGLAYLHDEGVLHRDMKGSNILVNAQGELKLADFGLARFYNKRRVVDYTNRVITLWYRPPELLLGATQYGPEVDMWSAGCIILELFSKKIPFPGTDEINQLDRIYDLCGTPLERDWPDLTELPWYELLKRTDAPLPSRLDAVYASMLSPGLLDLVHGLLEYDPKKRLLAPAALAMPYFTTEDPPMQLPSHLAEVGGEFHELEAKREKAKKRAKGKAEGRST